MVNIDKKATDRLRNDMMKSYERLFNSPAMQLMRERDKGIHPTTHDKQYTGTKVVKVNGHYKVIDR